MNVQCPYCHKPADFIDSSIVYGRSYGMIYLCIPCDAYVGTHKGTTVPLGTLANAELRELRKTAHHLFDPIWQNRIATENIKKYEARGNAYFMLSKFMRIPQEECHIAMFDKELCLQCIDILTKLRDKNQ